MNVFLWGDTKLYEVGIVPLNKVQLSINGSSVVYMPLSDDLARICNANFKCRFRPQISPYYGGTKAHIQYVIWGQRHLISSNDSSWMVCMSGSDGQTERQTDRLHHGSNVSIGITADAFSDAT